jgi:dihydroorotate dehydrogenase electron transfer subunit
MLKAVAHLCAQFDVPCQISLEENMPCGVGVCNGCVVGVHGAGDDYGRYRRICVEGPVLWANEIDWGRLAGGGCP